MLLTWLQLVTKACTSKSAFECPTIGYLLSGQLSAFSFQRSDEFSAIVRVFVQFSRWKIDASVQKAYRGTNMNGGHNNNSTDKWNSLSRQLQTRIVPTAYCIVVVDIPHRTQYLWYFEGLGRNKTPLSNSENFNYQVLWLRVRGWGEFLTLFG